MTEEHCCRCEYMRVETFCSPRVYTLYSCSKYKDGDDRWIVLRVDRRGLPLKLVKCIKENEMTNEKRIEEWLDALPIWDETTVGSDISEDIAKALDKAGFTPPEELPELYQVVMMRNNDSDCWSPREFLTVDVVEGKRMYKDTAACRWDQMRKIRKDEIWLEESDETE